MKLAPGTRLGPYELLAQIGAGGMAEVWKARDTRPGRIVATDLDCSRKLYAANREGKNHA